MTPTIRCIVLLSACSLWSACDEAKPQADKPSVVSDEAKAPALMPAQAPALTAAAPEPLKAVNDLAPPNQELTGVDTVDKKAELAKPDQSFERTLSASEVHVKRFVLARGVKGHEPVGVTDSFDTASTKLFAFVELENSEAPYTFRVHWEPVEGPSSPYGVELKVPTAERFRTWSWTAIEREPGRYRAVLRTLDGEEIASRELTISEASE